LLVAGISVYKCTGDKLDGFQREKIMMIKGLEELTHSEDINS